MNLDQIGTFPHKSLVGFEPITPFGFQPKSWSHIFLTSTDNLKTLTSGCHIFVKRQTHILGHRYTSTHRHRPHRRSSCRGSRWPGPQRTRTSWCDSVTAPCKGPALVPAPCPQAWAGAPGHSSRGARHAASWLTFTGPFASHEKREKNKRRSTLVRPRGPGLGSRILVKIERPDFFWCLQSPCFVLFLSRSSGQRIRMYGVSSQ